MVILLPDNSMTAVTYHSSERLLLLLLQQCDGVYIGTSTRGVGRYARAALHTNRRPDERLNHTVGNTRPTSHSPTRCLREIDFTPTPRVFCRETSIRYRFATNCVNSKPN